MDTVDVYTLTDVTIHGITGGWGPEYIPFCIQIISLTPILL